METLIETKTKKITEHSVAVLQEETAKLLNEIKEFAEFNEYKYNINHEFDERELNLAIMSLTLNQRKKLKKRINIFRVKQSLSSANRFYHFIFTHVLKSPIRIRLVYPKKHQDIMLKRKKFVELRKQMEEALASYKEEKGDYYKLRLEKGQKI